MCGEARGLLHSGTVEEKPLLTRKTPLRCVKPSSLLPLEEEPHSSYYRVDAEGETRLHQKTKRATTSQDTIVALHRFCSKIQH